ncbi:MAG: transposase, partial [Bacteroidia bacterium]|nr:transposase [Bacteroidia bacterium]
MKNQRRKFSTEFKTKVLQEVKLNENAIIAIAKKFDLSPAQIYSWKR